MMPDPRTLFLGGDLEGARAAYDEAIEERPEDAALLAGRAAVRLYSGEVEGSRADVERAIRLDANCADAYLLRARMIEPEDRVQAIAEASRAIQLDPGNTPALYWRAVWKAGTGDAKGAREDLDAIVSREPADAFRLQVRGQAHLAMAQFDEAAKRFSAAIEGGLALPFVYYGRAEARSRLQDRAGAIEDFTRILERTPGDAGIHAERARERSRSGDLKGALEDLERSIDLDPGRPQPYYYRGVLRSSQPDLSRAASMTAVTADDQLFRGLVLELLGRRDEAAEAFARARELAPLNHPRRPEIESKSASVRPVPKMRKVPEKQSRAPATVAIVAVNIAVWALQGDFMQPTQENLLRHGALWGYSVGEGEYWRLVTAMFLHIGPLHLFMNMFFGYGWCSAVEKLVGTWRFGVAYVLSGVGASAVSLLGHVSLSAGASGALFGVIGMVLVAFYARLGSLRAFFDYPRVRGILWTMAIWFVLGLSLHFDNYAHFGGLVFGVLFGLLFMKVPTFAPVKQVLSWLVVLVLLAGTAVAASLPRRDPELKVQTLLWRGKVEEARTVFDDLIRRDPVEPAGYLYRAKIWVRLKETARAIEDLKKALEVAPPNWKLRAETRKELEDLERGERPR